MTAGRDAARWTHDPRVLAHVLLLGVVLVWGTTFTLIKSVFADISPLLFNLIRMALAFALLLSVNARALRGVTRRQVAYCAAAGVFLGVGFQLQTAGLARTSASKSAFITGLVVVIVPLLSTIRGVRAADIPRPRWTAFAGAAAAFAGLVLLTVPASARGSVVGEVLSGFGSGETLTLLCAVAFAAHVLTIGRAARLVNARVLGTFQIGFMAALMLVTLPLGGPVSLHWTTRLVLTLTMTAVLATAAAYTIQSWAQQHLSSTNTALIFTLEPVFAWLTSLLILHERLTARELAGAGLILAGVLVAELLSLPMPRDSPEPESVPKPVPESKIVASTSR